MAYFIEDRSGTIRSIERGTLANRPASDVGQLGRWYITSDAPRRIFEDLGNGLANGWVEVGSPVPATNTVLGIVKTSVAPVDSANPIAVGDNDVRNTNARTPTAHAASHAPGGSDALAVDAAAATGSLRTLGTGAQQAAPGNHTHPRLMFSTFFLAGDVNAKVGDGLDPIFQVSTADEIRVSCKTAPAGGTLTLTFVRVRAGVDTTIGSVTLAAGAAKGTTTGLAVALAVDDDVRVDVTTGTGYTAGSAKNVTAKLRYTY